MSKTIKVNGSTYYLHTNWHTRPLVPLIEVPMSVQESQFDYVQQSDDNDDYAYDCRFFNYLGYWYDSHEFERAGHDVMAIGFNAVQTDSYFSATVVQWFDKNGDLHDEGNSVVVGRIHW